MRKLLATIRVHLIFWAGAFPSHAFLPACYEFCLPRFAPIWPTGLAPFFLMLFSLLVAAFACHYSGLFGPLGWPLSFSCFSPCSVRSLLAAIRACLAHGAGAFPSHAFSPCLLWLLLATIRAYLVHWAGAFRSHIFLPACCRFYLPPFTPIWPTGPTSFLLLLFSLLVGIFAYLAHWGWRLSFTGFSPCLLRLLLATIRAYLTYWAGAFPSHAFLPACCGFCLPLFGSIWPSGLAPFLLMLFSLLSAVFTCRHSRLFGPWGWRLSFSCFSPCLLWLLLATIRAYLVHWAGAFRSHAFLPAC